LPSGDQPRTDGAVRRTSSTSSASPATASQIRTRVACVRATDHRDRGGIPRTSSSPARYRFCARAGLSSQISSLRCWLLLVTSRLPSRDTSNG
jgi:hypothetical protein